MERDPHAVGGPARLLTVADGVLLTVGMVVGVGIFKLPSMVAGNLSGTTQYLLAWLLGGAVSLCGALVYAELSARHPVTGGEYAFLGRGLGRGAAFLFAWSRMTVIQTGAIVAVAFAFGDYASELLRLGAQSPAIYAALGVGALTLLNLAGTMQSKTLHKVVQVALVAAMVLLALGALATGEAPEPAPRAAPGGSFGLAMIFVLFTYGGWNEAAYLAGEVRDAQRNMARILVGGIFAVTALYLLVNVGYLSVLGLTGVKESNAVAADAMRRIAGDGGARLLSLVVCVSALTTMNAAIFTGARTSYAFGSDFAVFAKLGAWRARGSTPANALVVQGAIMLVLVAAGSVTPDGFSAMVAYTAPVFWTFFLLTGVTLFVFRARGGEPPAFRVPLHPAVTLAFCATCVYMLYSSIDYIRNPDYGPKFGAAVLGGLAVMAAGIPLYFLAGRGTGGRADDR